MSTLSTNILNPISTTTDVSLASSGVQRPLSCQGGSSGSILSPIIPTSGTNHSAEHIIRLPPCSSILENPRIDDYRLGGNEPPTGHYNDSYDPRNRHVEGPLAPPPVSLFQISTNEAEADLLAKAAAFIQVQPWFKNGKKEPPMTKVEAMLWSTRLRAGKDSSMFDLFFYRESETSFRCLLRIQSGVGCSYVTSRLSRARAHARGHFDLRPFACEGRCGKPYCRERYSGKSQMNEHIRRCQRPKAQCEACLCEVSVQNLKRHLKSCKPAFEQRA